MSIDNDVDQGHARPDSTGPDSTGPGSTVAETTVDERPGEPATGTGPGEHTVLLPRISTDPLDELVDRVRPTLGRAVDALQVTAALESDGFSDRGARVEYGYADVFALAVEVFRRLGPTLPPVTEAAPAGRHGRRWESLRQIAHGPMYVLPSAVFPAAMAVAGRRSLVLALVFASGLGWVYAGTTAHAAFRLLGFDRPRSAARVLRGSTLSAPLAGAVLGSAVVWIAGGGLALIVLATCQLAYQLASTVLVFYRREGWLVWAMTPAFLAGLAYLILGSAWRSAAVGAAIASVAAALIAALWATRNRGSADELPSGALLRLEVPMLFGVSAYGLCSAILLLHAEAPYLNGRLDVAVAVAPLLLAMGFVEWRAGRFRERSIALTRHTHQPRAFVRGVWLLLIGEMVTCLAVPAVLAGVLLTGLWQVHLLSSAGVVMTAAHVALAGAYYLAYLLAGLSRFGWLCLSMLAALALHVGVGAWLGVSPLLGQPAAPLADTSLYLGSVLLLQALFMLGLAPLLGQVRHYR
jgi:hypothetical protein